MTSGGRYSDVIWSSSNWEPPTDYDSAPENWHHHHHVPSRRHFNRLHHPSSTSTRDDDNDDDDAEAASDENGDDSEGNPKTFRRVCERFAERTSMQGIPYVHGSRALHARAVWALIFVAGLGLMSAHLYLLIAEFYQYETQTQVDLGFSPLRFPAVTVCNINRIRMSKMELASKELEDLIAEIQPSNIVASMEDLRASTTKDTGGGSSSEENGGDTPPDTRSQEEPIDESGSTSTEQATPPPSGSEEEKRKRRKRRSPTSETPREGRSRRVRRFVEGFEINQTSSSRSEPSDAEKALETYYTNKTTTRQIEDEVEYLYSIQERADRVEMGHQIEDMLISCSFAGYECYAEDFELFQTAEYGNCYSIQNSQFTSLDGGPSNGLELILYLESSDYLGGMTTSKAGVQVLVHEPGTWPLPSRRGFAVPAAMETYVALRQINLQRASQPYGDCQEDDPALRAANVKYTRSACQIMCQQSAIHDTCGCFDASEEELNIRAFGNTTLQFCYTDEEITCLTQVSSDFISGALTCSCGNPCSDTEYTKTQSGRAWPSTDYAAVLAEDLCSFNVTTCEAFKSLDVDELSQNFIKLVIYFEDLNYENITEKPDYAETQFISDVGGTVGLWIGLSVISVFEVLQFFYEVLHYLLYVKPKKQQQGRAARRRARTRHRKPEQEAVTSHPTMSSTLSAGFPASGALKTLSMLDSHRHNYLTKI